MCFCHDLIRTLENPFEVAKNRFVKYMIMSITIPILIMVTLEIMRPQEYPTRFYEERWSLLILNQEHAEPPRLLD